MNMILKTARYLFYDIKKAIIIYSSIIIALALITAGTYLNILRNDNIEIGAGFDLISVIFMFIAGLNSFKSNFKFTQANNIPRDTFFKASVLTLAGASLFITLLDLVTGSLLRPIVPYTSIYEQMYHSYSLLPNFLYSLALTTLASAAGFFITMLYYKCNSLMKVIISISPVIFSVIISRADSISRGSASNGIEGFIRAALGLETHNSYIAALFFGAMLVVATGLNYLMLRRMTIKD